MITLLVVTDGRRDCLRQTLGTLNHMAPRGVITNRLIVNDSADPDHGHWLTETYGPGTSWEFDIVNHGQRLGFGGAIRSAWAHIKVAYPDCRFVFHVEDDFSFERPVELAAMANVLDRHPRITQLVLRRQPWNDEERAAGGIVEQHPEAYVEKRARHHAWLEHRLFFSTNPSLYRRTLCDLQWPDGDHSEGVFTHRLLDLGTPEVPGDDVVFAFWGARDSGEWVHHIGRERVGVGY